MEYTIRKVSINDIDKVTAVEAQCFPEAEAAGRADFQARIQAYPDSFFVVETTEGKIIGFINGCVTDDQTIEDEMFEDVSLHNPEGAYQAVFGLDVIEEYRKQGVAAGLMERLIEEARSCGRKGIILTCKDRLITYYEKYGYRNLGVSKSVHGGAVWYDMILEF